ncbi:MAG: hypothetical protein D6761_00325 [Candidatus Dadabacteria bacterium]|nr:MAG: hypothetical protein D6761_00325 [Candidatus Dadabacteria bacterium]
MGIERKGNWIQTTTGSWVNARHLDLIEVAETDGVWVVRAWNALQPQVDPYILSEVKTEATARKQMDALVAELGASTS